MHACSVAESYLIFCDPVDCSLPSSSVRGISQARILEWVAFSSPGGLPDPEIEPASNVKRDIADVIIKDIVMKRFSWMI